MKDRLRGKVNKVFGIAYFRDKGTLPAFRIRFARIGALALFFMQCLLANNLHAASEYRETERADGSTLYWKIDRPAITEKIPTIVLAQGSGCLSVEKSRNIALVRSVFNNYAALTCEKYGVNPGDEPEDDHTGCSTVFYENHTITQRVADYCQVIDVLRGESWWNGQLILFGGSEGGDVVAQLAIQTKADATVLLSTGGGLTFGEMVQQSIQDEMERRSVPRENWPDVEDAFVKARENPQSGEIFGGSSYRFWADAIDHRIIDSMMKAQGAFLLIQGSNDTSVSAASARMAVDIYAKTGGSNMTYWEFTGYDHAMIDGQGVSKLEDVLFLVAVWVRQQLR